MEDLIEAYFQILLNKKFFGKVINVGNNDENKILDIINIVKKNLNKDIKVSKKKERIRPIKSEVQRLRCNNSFIVNNSKWSPEVSLEKGIIKTIDWFKKNITKEIASKYII